MLLKSTEQKNPMRQVRRVDKRSASTIHRRDLVDALRLSTLRRFAAPPLTGLSGCDWIFAVLFGALPSASSR